MTYFISTTGSDANDGFSPATAIKTLARFCAISSANDVAMLSAGTFDEGTSNLPLKSGQQIIGAGKTLTTILSQKLASVGCIINLADNVVLSDFYLNGNLTTTATQCPLGCLFNDAGWIGVVLNRVKVFGDIDGFFLNPTVAKTCSAKCYDSDFVGGWDLVTISKSAGGCLFEFYNCTFDADYSYVSAYNKVGGGSHPGITTRCLNIGSNSATSDIIRVFGGRIRSKGTPLSQGVVVRNKAISGGSSPSIVQIYGEITFDCDNFSMQNLSNNGVIAVVNTGVDPETIDTAFVGSGDGSSLYPLIVFLENATLTATPATQAWNGSASTYSPTIAWAFDFHVFTLDGGNEIPNATVSVQVSGGGVTLLGPTAKDLLDANSFSASGTLILTVASTNRLDLDLVVTDLDSGIELLRQSYSGVYTITNKRRSRAINGNGLV